MSGKRFVGLASTVVVGLALAGCQHRCGDRRCQTDPPYAQNTPPVPSSGQSPSSWTTPGNGAGASMPGPGTPVSSANPANPNWTSTPGMGTSGPNSMPAGRTMGMSTGSSLSNGTAPGYGLTTPAPSNGAGASNSLIPPNPSPTGTGNVPVMPQGYDTLH